MADHSLETTKRNLSLAYGDAGLGDMQIIRMFEYEKAQLEARLEAIEARLDKLEEF